MTEPAQEKPWLVRPYERADEDCVVSMWLRSFARSRSVAEWMERRGYSRDMPRVWFTREASDEARRQEQYYWRFFRPLVLGLVYGCETRVLVDAERASASGAEPSVIYAWACVSPGLVHYVAVKQEALRAGQDIAADMVADLLADRLDTPQEYTWEQRELRRMGLLPADWSYDERWLDSFVRLSAFSRTHRGLGSAIDLTSAALAVWEPEEAA